jgi:hypothetical protein
VAPPGGQQYGAREIYWSTGYPPSLRRLKKLPAGYGWGQRYVKHHHSKGRPRITRQGEGLRLSHGEGREGKRMGVKGEGRGTVNGIGLRLTLGLMPYFSGAGAG